MTKKSVILATTALIALGLVHASHDVSRLGKNLKLVLDLTGTGATTPKTLYGKTKNAGDEPKYTNYLTPLGQRQ
jgi:hypothetical protein